MNFGLLSDFNGEAVRRISAVRFGSAGFAGAQRSAFPI